METCMTRTRAGCNRSAAHSRGDVTGGSARESNDCRRVRDELAQRAAGRLLCLPAQARDIARRCPGLQLAAGSPMARRHGFGCALITIALVAACGSSAADDDDGVDAAGDPGSDAAPGTPDAAPGDNHGTLPDPVTQSGVAYIGQFGTSEVTIVRTDGAEPVAEGTADVGDWVRDMDVDPYHDLLSVVHEGMLTVRIYQLGRPAGSQDAVPTPTMAAELTMPAEHYAIAARFDPPRQRLYVVSTTPLPDTGPVTEYRLYTFDIADPTTPEEIGTAQVFPTAISFGIDYGREILFALDFRNDQLVGYDIAGDELVSLGAPLELKALFPESESNSFAFQARNLVVDMYRNRLYAARSQGIQSELMVLEYPPDVPRGSARYGDFASMSDLTVVPDPFPTQEDPAENPNLFDAYVPAVDQDSGDVFLVADAWSGSAPTAIMVPIGEDMELATACDAFEGFGCWYLFDGDTGPFVHTDTAACVDSAHNVFVGASKDAGDEANPGAIHFYKYDEALATTPWLPSGDTPLKTLSLPVVAVCH